MPQQRTESPSQTHDHAAGLFVRLFWLVGGFAGVALTGIYIMGHGSAPFTIADLLYWAIVGLAVGARWLDIVRFGGTTADGRAATRTDGLRYTAILVSVAFVVWGLAHLLRGF